MNEKKFEQLSSLVDDQDHNVALLKDVKQNDELSDAYGRYHLIGDIMRDERSDFANIDLSVNIAEAIAQEPTVFAPKMSNSVVNRVKAKVVNFVKPVGQMAIAASAAGLMVLGVQQANTDDGEQMVPSQVWQPLPVAGFADPVSYNFPQQSESDSRKVMIERQQRMQSLLADHEMQIKLKAKGKAEQIKQPNEQ
ncbi:sigma-E factor negative regulatory protein [Thalassotalea crassostreae]|uniref:sigma-E factor negative regulatory protein n=1 Tax=Thalassotalea crassostreae TaxID=1763536 RepID=UPI000839417D|nr:RseA family anti-sigma factor [Thalassotalea crassostreae]